VDWGPGGLDNGEQWQQLAIKNLHNDPSFLPRYALPLSPYRAGWSASIWSSLHRAVLHHVRLVVTSGTLILRLC
jgi:hypothetical protein